MTAVITQKYGVTLSHEHWNTAKNASLSGAISLSDKCIKSGKATNLKKIANLVQRNINNGQLTYEKVAELVEELKASELSSVDAAKLMKHLIILAKHNNGNKYPTKINWFGFTNRTSSISNFIKSLNNPERLAPEAQASVKALEWECEGEIEEIIGSSYKNATHYENSAKKFIDAAQNYPAHSSYQADANLRAAEAYSKAVKIYARSATAELNEEILHATRLAKEQYLVVGKPVEAAAILTTTATLFNDFSQFSVSTSLYKEAAKLFVTAGAFDRAGINFFKVGKIYSRLPKPDPVKIEKMFKAAEESFVKSNLSPGSDTAIADMIARELDISSNDTYSKNEWLELLSLAELAMLNDSYTHAAVYYIKTANSLLQSKIRSNGYIATIFDKAAAAFNLSTAFSSAGMAYRSAAASYYRDPTLERRSIYAYAAAVKAYVAGENWQEALATCNEGLKFTKNFANLNQLNKLDIGYLEFIKPRAEFEISQAKENTGE
jgi:hypothetical protein